MPDSTGSSFPAAFDVVWVDSSLFSGVTVVVSESGFFSLNSGSVVMTSGLVVMASGLVVMASGSVVMATDLAVVMFVSSPDPNAGVNEFCQ